MTETIRILDLFCGEGGASMGYFRAASKIRDVAKIKAGRIINIEIVGVDKRPMKRYPFDFIEADALSLDYEYLDTFDFIHASPPCKSYTSLYHFSRHDIDKSVLPRVLMLLEAAGKPYVVENVPQAPIRADVQLDGTMFNLALKRRRIFQTNASILRYPHATRYSSNMKITTVAGNSSTLAAASKAMGIYWMSKKGINEAIPPAYTKWIGMQILPSLYQHLLGVVSLRSQNAMHALDQAP